MLSRIRWFLIISGVLLLAIFSLANTTDVEVKMPLVFHATVPLAMLLAVSALIGFMVGALWTAWMLRARKNVEQEKRVDRSGVDRSGGSGKPVERAADLSSERVSPETQSTAETQSNAGGSSGG